MTSATYFQNVLILGSKTFVQHAWARNAALHLGIVERSCVKVQKLPAGALLGAELLSRHRSNEPVSADPLHIRDELGVQRMNDDCLELGSGGHLVKSIYGSAIGVLFVMGIGASLLTSLPASHREMGNEKFVFADFSYSQRTLSARTMRVSS